MIGLDIVAVAARTPVGLVAETSAAAVRAGISRITEYPFLTPSMIDGELVTVARDGKLDTALVGAERMLRLGQAVLEEVAAKLMRQGAYPAPIDLLLALPEERPGFTGQDAVALGNALVAALHASGANIRETRIAGLGHAGVVQAIEQVARAPGGPREDALLVVLGVDSHHHVDTFVWLERERRFAGAQVRGGFIPGEGAGALVLAHSRLRHWLQLPRLASVTGVGVGHERLLRASETGSFGEGMSAALSQALAGHELPRDAADAVYLDLNGERYRSEEWGFVAMKSPTAFRSLDYEAPADCWGDVGAASGALLGMLAVRSFVRGYAPGPRALVLTGSDSGSRAVMGVMA